MLYMAWMVILGDHGIKKYVSKTSIFELHRVKNCRSRLCTNPLGAPPPPPPPRVHNLLLQFFTLGSSIIEVFETCFFFVL